MDAEQRFQQFQQTREPAHLGAVFDLVADELFAFIAGVLTQIRNRIEPAKDSAAEIP